MKNYGRVTYMLSVGFGECAVDLSFIAVLADKGVIATNENAPGT